MNRILIIAEHDGVKLNPVTARCVSCAVAIGGSIDILVLGAGVAEVAAAAAQLQGVNRVLLSEAEQFAHPLAANWAPELVAAAAGYSYVLAPSTTFGKDLLPRAAALLGVNPVSDIMSVQGPRAFQRPVYAGNAILDVEVPADCVVAATVRIASWREAASGGAAPVETRPVLSQPVSHTRWLSLATDAGERPDLQAARVVVSGGRALGSAENFQLIYKLADRLGAAVGASRAAVDAGYVANDLQVGQTGKIIAPEFYLAFGISGAIQHLTGIKDAGTIVAVNKDADAPIFEVADLGLVGDLFTVIPELERLLG